MPSCISLRDQKFSSTLSSQPAYIMNISGFILALSINYITSYYVTYECDFIGVNNVSYFNTMGHGLFLSSKEILMSYMYLMH